MVQFIKIGANRIKLDTIERYGIKCGVRYLVKMRMNLALR